MAATYPLGFVQRHHLKMDNSTGYVTLLRACAKNRDLCKGTRLHDDILRLGLVNQCSDALATMYAKCGALSKAKTTLEAHKSKDVLTWTALISAYTERGGGQNALDCFEQMRSQEICPDAVTFATILKACGIVGAADKGEMIHDNIIRQGLLEKDIVLGGAVVHMYAKCGALAKAQKVLDELPIRNVVSWSAIIAGYAQHGQADQALNCFERMLSEGHSPNPVTFSCILKACGSLKAADRGAKIHDQIVRQGLLGNNVVLSNALIDMYVKCGALAKALQVMEDLRVRDVISWSALIAGFAQQDQGQLALKLFESMQDEGVSPDEMTLACILKVCGRLEAADKGVEVHNEIVRQGLETNIVLGNGLVDMYVKFGALLKAERIFEELPLQDVNSWNALIRGYVQESRDEQALKCYEQMQHEGVSPDAGTFSHILPACASLGAYEKGEKIHYEIDRQGLLNSDLVLGNAIVHMYAKCGDLVKAQQVLDNLPMHNFDTRSAIIIEGYAQHAQSEQVLNCFEQMQEEGFCPNAEIYACTLQTCGRIGAVDKGQAIHEEIATTKGFLGNNVTLIFCLVDMYANCGAHGKAQEVLEQLHVDADISWSALIIAYAQHGQGEKALFCYKCMQREGILPNAAVYMQILKV